MKKGVILIFLGVSFRVLALDIVVETDDLIYLYTEDGDLKTEYNPTTRLLKHYEEDKVTIYLNQTLQLNLVEFPFLPPMASSYSKELSRKTASNGHTYIEKQFFIKLEGEGFEKDEIEGEPAFYNPLSKTFFFFKGNPLWVSHFGESPRLTPFTLKALKSITGDSSYRFVFQNKEDNLWLFSNLENSNIISIYTLSGQLVKTLITPKPITKLSLVTSFRDQESGIRDQD